MTSLNSFFKEEEMGSFSWWKLVIYQVFCYERGDVQGSLWFLNQDGQTSKPGTRTSTGQAKGRHYRAPSGCGVMTVFLVIFVEFLFELFFHSLWKFWGWFDHWGWCLGRPSFWSCLRRLSQKITVFLNKLELSWNGSLVSVFHFWHYVVYWTHTTQTCLHTYGKDLYSADYVDGSYMRCQSHSQTGRQTTVGVAPPISEVSEVSFYCCF